MSETELKLTKCINKVSKGLGKGLGEVAYQRAMEIELQKMGYCIIREYYLPQYYRGIIVSNLRCDLCITDLNVLVELKVIVSITDKERNQAKKYKELSGMDICLVNFGHKGVQIEFY